MRIGAPAVLALLAAFAAAVALRRPPAPAPVAQKHHTKPWSLQPAPSGMIFSWDRGTPELQDAARVELVLHEAARRTTHALERRAGTLVIPFTPQAAILHVDDKRYAIYGTEPQIAEHRPPTEPKPRTPRQTVILPMLLSNRGHKVVSTASVVLPRVPGYVHRPLDIDLLIKVTPQGAVSSVASNYGHDPLRNKLSAIASDAVAHWQFDRIAVNSYREASVRLVFSPDGVVVRPSSVG